MTMDNDDIRPIGNAIDEIKRLASYVEGFAAAQQSNQLARAAKWLEKLSRDVCGQGYIGCRGGYKCSSDHK